MPTFITMLCVVIATRLKTLLGCFADMTSAGDQIQAASKHDRCDHTAPSTALAGNQDLGHLNIWPCLVFLVVACEGSCEARMALLVRLASRWGAANDLEAAEPTPKSDGAMVGTRAKTEATNCFGPTVVTTSPPASVSCLNLLCVVNEVLRGSSTGELLPSKLLQPAQVHIPDEIALRLLRLHASDPPVHVNRTSSAVRSTGQQAFGTREADSSQSRSLLPCAWQAGGEFTSS